MRRNVFSPVFASAKETNLKGSEWTQYKPGSFPRVQNKYIDRMPLTAKVRSVFARTWAQSLAEGARSRRELTVSFSDVLWRCLSDPDAFKLLKAQANHC